LVLLDELGAGTDPDEGAAIGQSVLDELLKRGCLTIVTTHLGTLKSTAYRRRRVDNAAVEFDVATLQPKYSLRIGEPGESKAIAIAKRLGMPRRLVQAAERNLSGKHRALSQAIAGTVSSRRRAEAIRAEAERAKNEASEAAAAAHHQAQLLQKKRGEFEQWTRQVTSLKRGDNVYVRKFDCQGTVVRVSLQSQRAEVDLGTVTAEVPLSDLQLSGGAPLPARRPRTVEAKQPAARRASDRRAQPPVKRQKVPPAKRISPVHTDEKWLGQLKTGQEVFVRRFSRRGTLVRISRDKKCALVSVGAMELEVPLGDLAKPRKPASDGTAGSSKPRGGG
jgi:DNA mismatch repair protein MutS2